MKPLQEWTEEELKAQAYDELMRLEACRTNIKLIQNELQRRVNEQPKGPVESGSPRPE